MLYSIQHPRQAMTPTSISFNWRRSKDIPRSMRLLGPPVALKRNVYVSGVSKGVVTIYVYIPGHDVWDDLPPPPVYDFTIATVKDQLSVLVGGRDNSTREVSNKITVWDSQSRGWVHPYPPMATARDLACAVGYEDYLIVAGGYNSENGRIPDVNILDTTSRKWVTAESLPSLDYYSSVLIEDTLYLVGYTNRDVLRAHVPTLISHASSAIPISSQSVWESLPNALFYYSSPVAVDNMLLTVGGSTRCNYSNPDPTTSIQLYNPTNNEWTKVGDLPEAVLSCHCTVLSGELLVLGGRNGPIIVRSVYSAIVSQY